MSNQSHILKHSNHHSLSDKQILTADDGLDNDNYIADSLSEDEVRDDFDVVDAFAQSVMTNQIALTHTVTDGEIGTRLDKLGAECFEGFSRVQIGQFIDNGELLVNDAVQKAKYRVKDGDVLTLNAHIQNHSEDVPEDIPLDIIYEDETVIVINKPAGLVVHPGAGNRTGTLVNGLLFHDKKLANLPRAGLVHRIDKDTTGLLVVAKTKEAQLSLIDQLKDKSVYRLYQCVATGASHDILKHATIDLPIARHPTQRTKMAVRDGGKPAVTHIVESLPLNEKYSLLKVRLETGRTHQIRVHLSHFGFGLVGDKTYGSPIKGVSTELRALLQNFPRQALHAYRLGFVHPKTGEQMIFDAPMPSDLHNLIQQLKNR